MKEQSAYTLPPIDEEAFALAIAALRAAVQHERRVTLKWEPRVDELQKADEFSALRRRHENESYAAEQLRRWAVDLVKAAAVRGRPYPEHCYNGGAPKDGGTPRLFDEYGGAALRRAAGLVRAAYKAIDRTKVRFEVDNG